MLKNYFKTIIRNIRRNKVFTAINVVGLSLGLAAFIAISEYVKYETSFDSYNPNSKEIIRLGMETNIGESDIAVPFFGPPVARTIKADFPDIVAATRLFPWIRREYFVKYGETEIKEKALTRMFADANFFDFFGIDLIQGDQDNALASPNAVVITESMAEKYFGSDWQNEDVLGEFIEIQELEEPLQITGVSIDVPINTHFTYNFLVSMTTLGDEERDVHWLSNAFFHYFQLAPENDPADFMEKLSSKKSTYLAVDMKDFLGTSYDEYFSKEGAFFDFFYQPLESIHLNSHYELEIAENGDNTYVNIMSAVSVLVLLMAAINFMNLSMVAGLKRHKEVGIRKVLGSLKGQLVFQFLFESVLIVCVALFLAITTIQLTAPIINSVIGVEIIPSLSAMIGTVLWLLLGATCLGMLSGLYPSLVLASYSPGMALRGGHKGPKSNVFRNTLIIFQFSISMLLTIGVTGIYKQVNFMRSQDLGYAKDQVMIINDIEQLGQNGEAFRDRVKSLASVKGASLSGFVPIGSDEYGVSGFKSVSKENDMTMRMRSAFVDENYLETYGIELLSGRGFDPINFNDSSSIVVNTQVLKVWGWSAQEAIGKKLLNIGNKAEQTIIGVMTDFQLGSLKEGVEPFFFELNLPGEFSQALSIQFTGEEWANVNEQTREVWNEFTDKPFSYTFASSLFDGIIQTEENAGKLFGFFSGLAILIGALGLLGVASFVVVQRSKEVGIRKVLGATIAQLLLTLSKSFIWLILISGVVAIPVAYFLLNGWLEQYVLKINISWMLFALPFLATLLIALGIVATQVLRVALVNPIKSLRYE